MQKDKRQLGKAVLRGLCGRCAACGKGRLLRNYIAPNASCSVCGEDLSRYQAADFAPYLVTFLVGLIFTPLTLVLTANGANDFALPVLLTAAVACAVLLLPPLKGAALALLWALNETN